MNTAKKKPVTLLFVLVFAILVLYRLASAVVPPDQTWWQLQTGKWLKAFAGLFFVIGAYIIYKRS